MKICEESMKKQIGIILKPIIFIGVLLLCVRCIENILISPMGTSMAAKTGMTESICHKKAYDVCFLGTSIAIANISNQELYENYGIAGISIGEPEQPIYLSKYTLEEFLLYQSPKVVFLDTKSLFYGKEWVEYLMNEREEDFIVHNSLDVINAPSIKKKALNDVQSYKQERIDLWDYYSKLYYSHENWKNLTYKNFEKYKLNDCMNGNIALTGIDESHTNIYDASDVTIQAMIDEKTEIYFSEIVNMCNESQIQLVLITGYTEFSKANHNAAAELAQKYKVDYIDINEHISDMNFAYKLDICDYIHFNLSGAIKWTDYLGEYLTQNYDFPDRRNDKSYDWYKEQSEIFNQQKEMMSAKQALLSAVTFDEYLAVLKGLNHYENAIFISVYDEASYCLTETEQVLLRDLGLNQDLTGKYRYSYAAFIYGNKVKEEISLNETVTVEGNIGDINYEVVSGGLTAGVGDASISINGKEYLQKGRGFNIVVYNTKLKQMISSAYFDTCTFVNPPQSRITTETINQHETAPNVWETER